MNPFKALLAGVAGIGAVLMILLMLGFVLLAGGFVFCVGFVIVGALSGGSTFAGVIGGIFCVLLALALVGGTLS